LSHSSLLINELLAINDSTLEHEGSLPDLVELYYDGPSELNLAGVSITDDPEDPHKFVFGAATTIKPGEYLLLLADSGTTVSAIHLGFALDGDGEALYLYDKEGELLDSVEFGMQLPDMSVGRTGTEGQWSLTVPTPGQANVAQPLGDPATLRINEWLASAEVLFEDDFVELYNPHDLPVDLSGLYITDNPVTQPDKYQLGPLSFVAGHGFAVLTADGRSEPGHVDFRLSGDGEMIALLDSDLNEIDKVLFGPQTTDVSQGRVPDPSSATASTVVINLIGEDATKRALVPATDIGQAWRTNTGFNDRSWTVGAPGPGGVGYERSSGYENLISLDLEPRMYGQNTSCYIRIRFMADAGDLSRFTELTLRMRYDDGFVAYLNGAEVARGNFSGTPTWNSSANASRSDSAAVVFEDIDISGFLSTLENGENLLAVHGLNHSLTSSDMLIGVRLDAAITTAAEEQPFAGAMDLLAGLRVTELMYHAAGGSNFDYVELANISDTRLDLTGVRISEGIEFVFGEMALEPGGHVVVVSNVASFRSAYGTSINIAGQYSGNLSNGGDQVVLQLPWPLEGAILRLSGDRRRRHISDNRRAVGPSGHMERARELAPSTTNPRRVTEVMRQTAQLGHSPSSLYSYRLCPTSRAAPTISG
ncbi:MAG: hypothetical protein AMJ65_16985, partial [Phycisphaerae bacterium SG8_4]